MSETESSASGNNLQLHARTKLFVQLLQGRCSMRTQQMEARTEACPLHIIIKEPSCKLGFLRQGPGFQDSARLKSA